MGGTGWCRFQGPNFDPARRGALKFLGLVTGGGLFLGPRAVARAAAPILGLKSPRLVLRDGLTAQAETYLTYAGDLRLEDRTIVAWAATEVAGLRDGLGLSREVIASYDNGVRMWLGDFPARLASARSVTDRERLQDVRLRLFLAGEFYDPADVQRDMDTLVEKTNALFNDGTSESAKVDYMLWFLRVYSAYQAVVGYTHPLAEGPLGLVALMRERIALAAAPFGGLVPVADRPDSHPSIELHAMSEGLVIEGILMGYTRDRQRSNGSLADEGQGDSVDATAYALDSGVEIDIDAAVDYLTLRQGSDKRIADRADNPASSNALAARALAAIV